MPPPTVLRVGPRVNDGRGENWCKGAREAERAEGLRGSCSTPAKSLGIPIYDDAPGRAELVPRRGSYRISTCWSWAAESITWC